MKTGILFDLDGTLLNTLEDLCDATNAALRHFGCPERSLEEIRSFIGNGARNQIRLSLPGKTDDPDVDAVLSWYKAYYGGHCQIKTAPFAGIKDALAELSEAYPIAIVSNKPDAAVKTLCALHFPGIFAMGESPACPRKPAPDMVFQAMVAIGAERCIYVGDSEVDVLTAKNAGVSCISVLWGFRDRETIEAAGGEHFCTEPSQLKKIVEEICRGQ
ncbi:MAG: HAD family hydrolase [Oscillospiraceae bacterium]|nr:HAD family hydrolase [Oscillospiraceae bacterium]